MYRGHTVGVVVPAYNEEAHIGEVLETMPPLVDLVYAVDDCSTDGTWDVIRSYADRSAAETGGGSGDRAEVGTGAKLGEPGEHGSRPEPATDREQPPIPDGGVTTARSGVTATGSRIVPIRHEENQGAGGALRTGYIHAYADGVDVAVAMDADGQMDPAQLPALLDPVVEGVADYAKGNRLATPDDWREMPPFRLFGNWLLTVLTKASSGYWRLQDPQNGYTAMSQRALSELDLEAIPDDHDYTNDLLVRLNAAGFRVADVSMPAVYRDEESTIDFGTFVRTTSVTLARGFLWRLRWTYRESGRYAVPLCYACGVAGTAVAATAGLATVASLLAGSAIAGGIGQLAAVLFGVGIVALLAATVLDVHENRGLEVKC
ncbi:glycosyltransferase family 2 protein [Halomontanus rarus]|uniref:glycosyltransferase family 2 protein n=1 Tax=Halomontanus rarus TaxID=3034020 RepID=UPI0023E82246|nr:glycosyltransferase family 2 protein [Halovivax sp. TS33]